MRITGFSDYCLRVLMYLAAHPERRVTIAEIAASYGISENHLVKVVHFLGKTGMLDNARGRGGGLALARPPERINVGAVVRRADGPAIPAARFDVEAPSCAIVRTCRLRGVLSEAVGAFYDVLDRYTLADLVTAGERQRQLRMLVYGPSQMATPIERATKP